MKWSNEIFENVIDLCKSGKSLQEIAILYNTTQKAILLKLNRNGYKYTDLLPSKHIIKKCLNPNCNKEFDSLIIEDRKFCSRSCAASITNLGNNKWKNKTTKQKFECKHCKKIFYDFKIRIYCSRECLHLDKSKNKTIKQKKKYHYIPKIRIKHCKCCGENLIDKYKRICNKCKFYYYNVYRFKCNFDFDIDQYINLIDSSLIESFGRYSPSNKGNNINGVSKDHIFSVKQGYMLSIDPAIIKHPANCQFIQHKNNQIKNIKSDITLIELFDKIISFENIIKSPNNEYLLKLISEYRIL